MKTRMSRTLVTLTLALLIVTVPAIMPRPRVTPPKTPMNPKVTRVAELKSFERAQRDEQLALLAKSGFRVGPTTVVAVAYENAKSPSLWDRISSAFAEEYSDGSTYVSLTALDDGNPNTFEFYAYGHDYQYGGTSWGSVQGSVNDPNNVWILNGGESVRCGDSSFDKLFGLVSPTVHARPDWCDMDYDWRGGLRNAALVGLASGVSNALWLPCWSGGWGGGAGCFAGGFVSGFSINFSYSLFNYSWRCYFLD